MHVAQAEASQTDAVVPLAGSEEDSATLVLTPAESVPEEISGTLIMQLVSEMPREGVVLASAGGQRVRSKAVENALRLRGSRYRYGGTSRGGFDCSGFTRYVYARLGIALPHSSAAQFQCGRPVSRRELRPGDLVFFGRGGRYVGHVGIYIGNNRFVHAANPSRGVTVDSLSGHYGRKYRGARRIRG